MDETSATTDGAAMAFANVGNTAAEIRETHTGIVVLIGDKAYKAKKPIVTDFLDFSTPDRRERACAQEVVLNSRLARSSYLGIAHLGDPEGGPAEPVIVMRRYPDSTRLASRVKRGEPVEHDLLAVAETLARFHADAVRGPTIDAHGTVDAVAARWQENLSELRRFAGTVVPAESIREVQRLVTQFISGRAVLFTQRITDRRIVDGHADLLADDIFCLSDGPALLDCLEFDDHLRYVDGIDDAAFLAMDLEFLGRKDLADYFLDQYSRLAGDSAPPALKNFYIAYRAVVRAKVDFIRVAQGHPDAATDAQRHIDVALDHLRAGAVRLILVGGGPGTGKTTLASSLAEQVHAQVISTDDVRRQLHQTGVITGEPGALDTGLYTADNVAAVYDAVWRHAHLHLCRGESVILDGTWRDSRHRQRAHELADETASTMVEFVCTATQETAAARIQTRTNTTSDATPEIAAALSGSDAEWHDAHPIDTSGSVADSVAEARELCSLTI
jgi:aminoglycoside phosphotransferase family enzyme/predicted kinase